MANVNKQPIRVTQQPRNQGGSLFGPFNDDWRVGLCSCCDDVPTCCFAYFCSCCFMYSLGQKIDEGCLTCCCVPNVLSIYRMKIRSILRIQGSGCNDCMTVCCCPFCSALQMNSELKVRGIA